MQIKEGKKGKEIMNSSHCANFDGRGILFAHVFESEKQSILMDFDFYGSLFFYDRRRRGRRT